MNAVLEAIVHKILKFYQRYNILLLNLQLLLAFLPFVRFVFVFLTVPNFNIILSLTDVHHAFNNKRFAEKGNYLTSSEPCKS